MRKTKLHQVLHFSAYRPKATSTDNHNGGGVMIWGHFAATGPGNSGCWFIDLIMNNPIAKIQNENRSDISTCNPHENMLSSDLLCSTFINGAYYFHLTVHLIPEMKMWNYILITTHIVLDWSLALESNQVKIVSWPDIMMWANIEIIIQLINVILYHDKTCN